MESYVVKSIDSEQCREWLLKKHYLKRMTSFTYSFGLYKEDVLVGVLTYGNAIPMTMKKSLFGETYMDYVYELNRLCTNDNLDKNANSFFISQSFKLLPKPMVIVSYADKSVGHNGYIYQATNFMFTGESHTQKDWKLKGKEHIHSRTLMYLLKTTCASFNQSDVVLRSAFIRVLVCFHCFSFASATKARTHSSFRQYFALKRIGSNLSLQFLQRIRIMFFVLLVNN